MDSNNNYYRYLKYKFKYSQLKHNITMEQNGGNKKRGLMVQAPMGSGKSYYIANRVPAEFRDEIVDGDTLLKSLRIKNRNFFWYDSTKQTERKKILDAFEDALNDGKIVLYSGHPILIPTDVLVIPDAQVRWDRLQNRSDFRPKRDQFEREQEAYEEASTKIGIVFNSDLPDYGVLKVIRDTR